MKIATILIAGFLIGFFVAAIIQVSEEKEAVKKGEIMLNGKVYRIEK